VIFNIDNVGYFKGLNFGIKYVKENYPEINHLIVGNNDLEFPRNFTDQLLKCSHLFNKYPVVSPDIITIEGEHQNPHVLNKISKSREFIFDLYYSNYILSKIILFLSKLTKKITDREDENNHNISSEIYQGHGSCFILGPLFMKNFDELFAPSFLMSEEFFLAYQLKLKGYSIYYTPSINVTHFGHASLKNVPSKKIWKISKESHKIYKKYLKLYNKI
jgi:GT2 family glycosyltransferase